jgi:hypothetical protein
MPPRTADAADAFRSARREKLIRFSPFEISCSLRTNHRLIAASERHGNNGFRMSPRENSYGIRCWFRRRG